MKIEIGSLLAGFEQVEALTPEEKAKKIPEMHLSVDELTNHVFVDATIAVLVTLGLQDRDVLNVNDRTQMKDFPQADGEALEELSEMAGFEVVEDTFLWQVAKALSTGETPKHRARMH